MDWKVFYTVFTAIFCAELADKTQIMTMTFAATQRSLISVFFGSSLALISSTLIGVICGKAISRFVPILYLHNAAAILFIIIGVFMLVKKV